jgi:hypothetical protein
LGWDELQEITKSKNAFAEELNNKALTIDVKLPYIPRVGEIISIDFLDDQLKWHYEYVHRVAHEISGIVQRVIIFVHPFKNHFYELKQLEEESETQKRLRKINKKGF